MEGNGGGIKGWRCSCRKEVKEEGKEERRGRYSSQEQIMKGNEKHAYM